MKYIKQFSIIMTICLLGELLANLLPFTIPASVYGLFIMLIALVTKIIKPSHVKETSDFFMDVMPIMFVPASVGLMVSWGLLKEIILPVLIVSVLGTLIVMIVSGKMVDGIMCIASKNTVMSDGITVDGMDIEAAQVEVTLCGYDVENIVAKEGSVSDNVELDVKSDGTQVENEMKEDENYE